MKLTLIPAGEFMMGSPQNETGASGDEHPQHRVTITKPFYLGTDTVTKGQFAKFFAATHYKTDAEKDGEGGWGYRQGGSKDSEQKPEFNWRNAGFAQSDQFPVVNVSWNDAVAFCSWLGELENKTYRLPTEAEWEYACRAGTTTRYYFGDGSDDLALNANYIKTPNCNATTAVGTFRPNPYGLYDMLGNVWQWCSDWHQDDYYQKSPAADPQGPASGFQRVDRGGGWHSSSEQCRCANRGQVEPTYRHDYVGFRVVCEQ